MIKKSLKTAKDGTLMTTLGKTLIRSLKFKAADLRDPVLISSTCKEVTFAIVDNTLNLYIDKVTEEKRLTIENTCSIEAEMDALWIEAPEGCSDEDSFEIWIWR